MKDPDDFPVRDEAEREIVCLDCGTLMAHHEQEVIFDKYGPLHVCCNCGSGELGLRPRRRHKDEDLYGTLIDIGRLA